MKKFIRIYFIIWIVGFLYILTTNQVGFFKYLGLKKVNVFNSQSLKVAEWKINYFKKVTESEFELLPVVDLEGRPMSWTNDENIKYRVVLMNASIIDIIYGQNQFYKLKDIKNVFFPFFIDYCQRDEEETEYVLSIDSTKLKKNYIITLNRSNFSVQFNEVCSRLKKQKKNCRLSFWISKINGQNFRVI